jgi:Periplasmic binding proteins and sugar binding domain of LacI family
MVLGALEAARAADRVMLLMNTEGDRELEAREFAALLQHQVDGVLYATMVHRSVEVPAVLRDTPVVLVDAESADPTVSSAVPDEVGGAMTAVGELLGQGHRRSASSTTPTPPWPRPGGWRATTGPSSGPGSCPIRGWSSPPPTSAQRAATGGPGSCWPCRSGLPPCSASGT